ncbi:hypothetical protein PYW07_004161 [Mythimna separata]|uniref:Cilia- and flagella-associated protein 251 n=1 Tax=Mythimna separata TaxID=271217 RepID=A0AAD7YP71_MYTSE|nr:hypothetical protein PYW07_004161 [Mythimna separata]
MLRSPPVAKAMNQSRSETDLIKLCEDEQSHDLSSPHITQRAKKRAFSSSGKKLGKSEKSVEEIDFRTELRDMMNQFIASQNARLETLEAHILELKLHCAKIETSNNGMASSLNGLSDQITSLESKITGLDRQRAEMCSHLSALDEKIDTLERNMIKTLLLVVGYSDGVVELFNFKQHRLITRLDLRSHYTTVIAPDFDSVNGNYQYLVPELSVTCLKYSPSGLHLACALNTGQVLFFDPTTLELLTPTPFADCARTIHYISFSEDSKNMATADEDRTVCVYKYNCTSLQWQFLGKHRSHYKDITSINFLPTRTSAGEYRLVSLGVDRCMVEYDLAASGGGILELASVDRVDQTAIPLTAIVWPVPDNLPEECRTSLPSILVANDEFKYKIVNYSTAMTLATVLGPRYEYPVCKMQLITDKQGADKNKYLVFACKEVVGLQKMPLDGNPWKHCGMLAHPTKVLNMCFRDDLGILFTIGSKDTVLSQWEVQYKSVETTAQQGGIELDPYYCLVEDGRPGWLFQEIRDLFYYIQILCQGTFSPARREVKDYIPIDSLPDLMRALGFFPSEYEVENLIVEAKYKVYLKAPVSEIGFEEFVQLYLNHRPVFGESFKRLRTAFRTFAYVLASKPDEFFMKREDFIDMLSNNGEYFSRELCWYLLTILSGHSFEDRALMSEDDFSFLPEFINFNHFVTEIIGINELDDVSIPSGADSMVSSYTQLSMDSDD